MISKATLNRIKKKFPSAACRSGKKNLWIKRDLIVEYFKVLNSYIIVIVFKTFFDLYFLLMAFDMIICNICRVKKVKVKFKGF